MSNFAEDAGKLLEYVGGAANIVSVAHCITRMRFVLRDPAKTDVKAIERLPSVKGTFTQAGQFQVIVGTNVDEFHNAFTAVSGISAASRDDARKAAAQSQTAAQRVVNVFAEIFSPLIPAIVIGGLLLGFRNILEGVPLVDSPEGKLTIAQYSPLWHGVNHFLWLICEAIFHFLPVGVTWSISRKMGCTEILGIVLGITLVSPQLLNAYAVSGVDPERIPQWNFGVFQLDMIGYQAQVVPAMLAGFLLCWLERFFRGIIPQSVSMIVVPLLSLVPAVFLAHAVLGPFGWWLGSLVSHAVFAGLGSGFNWLFAFAFGFFYAPLVITGLHHMTNAIDLQLMADYGGTNLWPMIALSNIAQGSAVLAVIRLHRGNKKEEQISIPAAISCYLGVTEPAMFGINLKYVFPFVAGMCGSALAALISVLSGVTANSIGVGGIPGILAVQTPYWGRFALCMAVAVATPFVLTMVFDRFAVLKKKGEYPA